MYWFAITTLENTILKFMEYLQIIPETSCPPPALGHGTSNTDKEKHGQT